MKISDVILTANANLRRSKLRTFLTSSAVFMGAFTLMLTIGVSYGLKTYVQEQVNAAGAKDVMVVQVKADDANPLGSGKAVEYNPEKKSTTAEFGAMPALSPSDLEKISNQPGIKGLTPLYLVVPEYITNGGKKYQVKLTQSIEGLQIPLKSGRQVDVNSAEHEITIPPEFVSALGFANDQEVVGKSVDIAFKDLKGEIFTQKANVVGVQEKTVIMGNSMAASVSLVKSAFMQSTEGLPDFQRFQYSAAAAKFDTSLSEQQLADLKKSLGDQGYNAMTLKDQLGTITSVIDGITIFLLVFAGITLAAATFGIVNTLLMAVQERTREIGLMKALGMGRKKIFLLFSLEAVLIGLWSSLFALGVANLVGRLGNKIASQSILKDFEGLELFSFPMLPMLGIMAIVTTIAFLASTLPARRASRLNPIEALRYE